MNERIRKIAKQAGFNSYNYEGGNAVLFEKFTELIVQQCAEIADKESSLPCESYGELIKQHFGVKQ